MLCTDLQALPALCRREISLAAVKKAARWRYHPSCLSSTCKLLFVTVVGRKLLVAKVFAKLWTAANESHLALMGKTFAATWIIQKLLRLA